METVHFAKTSTPIGMLRVASTERGLAYLELPHHSGRGLRGWLERHLPGARCVDAIDPNKPVIEQIFQYLEEDRVDFEVPLDLRGTAFQHEVWNALRDIPYGESCSYADIARRIGRPRATRAVGSANNANPVALIVPCHRVIAADGKLGGYGGGVELKKRLLAMERSRACSGRLL